MPHRLLEGRAHDLRAQCFLASGQAQQALRAIDSSLECYQGDHPHRALSLGLWARARAQLGRSRAALDSLAQGAELLGADHRVLLDALLRDKSIVLRRLGLEEQAEQVDASRRELNLALEREVRRSRLNVARLRRALDVHRGLEESPVR